MQCKQSFCARAKFDMAQFETSIQKTQFGFLSKQLTLKTKAISLMITESEPRRSHFASDKSIFRCQFLILIRHNDVCNGIHSLYRSKLFQIYHFDYTERKWNYITDVLRWILICLRRNSLVHFQNNLTTVYFITQAQYHEYIARWGFL